MIETSSYDEKTNAWVIALSGDIEIYNVQDLKKELLQLIAEKKADIVLDATKLNYIDSTGLGVLVSVLKEVKAYGGKITIVHLKPYIAKIFSITGLDNVFSIEVDQV